jgi:hypothetical protein
VRALASMTVGRGCWTLPPQNQATFEWYQSMGQGSHRDCERRWWCRCRSHHGRCHRVFHVMSPSLAPQLSQVVVVGNWRWWCGTPMGGAAHLRRGAAHQGRGVTEGGWIGGGRRLGFGSSGNKKKNLSSNYHVEERCAAEY